MEGKKTLDLFAGSGSLGIEALSRGSSLVYFVDNSIQSIDLIRYNISSLPVEKDCFRIIKKDVLKFLRFCKDIKWDIIFLDPPYRIGEIEMEDVFDMIVDRKIAGSGSLLIYEYFSKRDITNEVKNLSLIKESFFGDKKVSYFNIL